MSRPLLLLAGLVACESASNPVPRDPFFATTPTPPPLSRCRPGVAGIVDGQGYANLMDAAGATVANDTVWVCPGTHIADMTFPGPGPYGIVGMTGDASDVVLIPGPAVASGTGDSIQFPQSPNPLPTLLRVQHLTFSNFGNSGNNDSPFSARSGSQLEISNVVLSHNGNPMGNTGALIGVTDSDYLEIVGLRAHHNTRADILHFNHRDATRGNMNVSVRDFECTDNTDIQHCIQIVGSLYNGARRPLVAHMVGLRFEDNSSPSDLFLIHGGEYSITIEDSVFSRNTTGRPGSPEGGILAPNIDIYHIPKPHGRVTIRRSDFLDNVSHHYGVAISGSMLLCYREWELAMLIEDSRFLRNVSLAPTQLSISGGYAVFMHATCGTGVWFRDVDFGSGADDNVPFDLDGQCAGQDLGFVNDLRYRDPTSRAIPPSCTLH